MPSMPFVRAKGQHRFPLELAARFRVLRGEKHFYAGATLEMSSAVVVLKTSHSLPVGAKITVDIDWPAKLDGIPLKLRVDGEVGRAEKSRRHSCVLEIAIRHWEIHLAKRAAGAKGAAHGVTVAHLGGQAPLAIQPPRQQ